MKTVYRILLFPIALPVGIFVAIRRLRIRARARGVMAAALEREGR